MPIRVTVANEETLVATGLPSEIPAERWRVWLDDIAETIEARIAKDFEKERGAGKPLGQVSDEHEQRKAIEGADLRRGHMFGDLQDALDEGGFARVSRVVRERAGIKFDENRLISRVAHAEWYAESKVKGGRLLVVLPGDAKKAEAFLNARAREFARGAETRTRRAGRTTSRREARRLGARAARALLRALR